MVVVGEDVKGEREGEGGGRGGGQSRKSGVGKRSKFPNKLFFRKNDKFSRKLDETGENSARARVRARARVKGSSW